MPGHGGHGGGHGGHGGGHGGGRRGGVFYGGGWGWDGLWTDWDDNLVLDLPLGGTTDDYIEATGLLPDDAQASQPSTIVVLPVTVGRRRPYGLLG